MVPAIVLAAGRSTRMGHPKALLAVEPGGASFIRTIVTTLIDGGIDTVIVVGRSNDETLRSEIDTLTPHARLVVNERADDGQLSSLVVGLNAADTPGVHAVLAMPVDVPLIRSSTIVALLATRTSTSAPIVRATYRGRHGHPVVFGREVFDELRRADPAIGAKSVVHAHERDTIDLEVDDPAVVRDVDTPEDYARMLDGLR